MAEENVSGQAHVTPLCCLQGGLARVMTHCVLHPREETIDIILRLLATLIAHPEVIRHAALLPTYRHLLADWEHIAERFRPHADGSARPAHVPVH